MLKTGKNLKNLVTWEVEEMWTLDNLEMILVGLNCLKFFFKEQLGLNQWVWYGSKLQT